MIRAFIFDLDGVVIDSEAARLKTYQILFENEFGVCIEFSYGELIGRSEKQNLKYLINKYNLNGNVSELAFRRSGLLFDAVRNEIQLIPVIIKILKHARDIKMLTALATNSKREYVELVIQKFEIKECFDIIISSENVKKPKPAPDLFIAAAKALMVKSKECLVFEDSPSGVSAARYAGMPVVGVLSTHNASELKGAQAYIDPQRPLRESMSEFFNLAFQNERLNHIKQARHL
jgi:HAD superfamily hydrolase (TIGR01509 family)